MATIKAQNTRFFNPTAVAGCQLWLDGVDTSSMVFSSGSNVSQWNDKSGLANNATAGGTGSPVLTQNAINGNQALYMSLNPYFRGPISLTGTTVTCFAVVLQTAIPTDSRIITLGTSTSVDYDAGHAIPLFTRQSTGNLETFRSGTIATVTATQNVGYLAECIYDGTNGYLYRNGILAGSSGSTGNFSVSLYGLGTRPDVSSTEFWQGYFGEFLIYSNALTTLQRQQVEGYLAYKWGLNSQLPTSHPYYLIPFFAEAVYFPQALIKITGTNLKHPAAIAGLSLWFDAQDIYGTGQSFPIGGIVRQWIDKSPFSNSTSNYSGSPLYSGAGINQYPAIYFKSSNSPPPMYFLGGLSQTFSGTQMNCFAVATIGSNIGALSNAYSAYGRILGLARPLANDFADPTTTFPFIQDNATQAVIIGRNSSYLSTPIPGYNTPFLVQSSHNGAMEYIGVNGNLTPASSNTGITGSFNITSYGVGVNPNTGDVGSQFTGYIGEVLAFLGVTLTTPQVQSVESYLAWKWGLQTSLATGHPYKTSPFMSPPYRNPIVRNNYTTRVDPRLFGGCQFWLDASDRGTISYSGSSVTSIREKAQNIVMTAQGTASFLTTPPTSIGSQQSLWFNNSSGQNIYLSGSYQSILTGCAFMVWKSLPQNADSWFPIFTWWTGGGTFPAYGYLGTTTNLTVGPYTTYGGNGSPTYVTTSNINYLAFYSWSGTSPFSGINGATPSSGTQPAFSSSSTGFRIGSDTGTATNMYLGELIIFNSVLGQTQRQQIEGYLAWKWGLKNSLPTTHPYYNFPPSP